MLALWSRKALAEDACLVGNDATTGGPIVSSPFVTEDKVYFGSLDRHIYAIEIG